MIIDVVSSKLWFPDSVEKSKNDGTFNFKHVIACVTDWRIEDDDVTSDNVTNVSSGPTADKDPVGAKAFVRVDRRAHGTPINRGRITWKTIWNIFPIMTSSEWDKRVSLANFL